MSEHVKVHVCIYMCKCKHMFCLNMVFLYMCEHVITCIHTCVSALIANMFGGVSSASELTPTWLCETPALIGPTYNNYRLPSWGAWHSQSVSPAKRPFSEGGSYLTWAILWICGLKPASVLFLWSILTYNNLILWLWTHRLRLWYGFWFENMLFGKHRKTGQWKKQRKEDESSAPQDNILTWLANQ